MPPREHIAQSQADMASMLCAVDKRTQETDERTREIHTMLAGTLAHPDKGLVWQVKDQGRRIGNVERRQRREAKSRRWAVAAILAPILGGIGTWIWTTVRSGWHSNEAKAAEVKPSREESRSP